jgi:hypothetical protein
VAAIERDWDAIRAQAQAMGSDGCTVVTEAFQDCCYLHDLCWRHGVDPTTGQPITYDEANVLFRHCIQSKSRLGRFSPVSWIRYFGVQWFGRFFR